MNNVNKIGLGTAAIGRPSYINIRQSEAIPFDFQSFRQKGMNILDLAYESGVRYFDTAPGYGMAEQLIIDWLKEKKYPNIEVATKWGYTYTANFNPNAHQHEIKEHSLDKLNEQWAKSKSLLPALTTYQIHSATFDTGVLENKAVLQQLAALKMEYGLHVGITTTGANQADVLQKALEVNIGGTALFDIFQVTYNIFDQSVKKVADYIAADGKRLVIKEAMANGRVFPNENYPHYSKAYHVLNQLAEKYGVGIDAIALRFCIDSIPVYKVLSGAAVKLHLTENLKANEFFLKEEEIAALKELTVIPSDYWKERKLLEWN